MTSTPERVCFILGRLNLGGIGRNALNLAEGLTQRGHQVDFFLIRVEGPYLSQVPTSVRVIHGAGTAKRSLRSLIRYLKTERVGALISGNPYVYVLSLAAARLSRSRAKLICTVHTNLTEDIRGRPLHERLITRAAILAYRTADAVIAVSSGAADDVAAKAMIPRNQVRVIYNPVVTPQLLAQAHQSVPCDILNAPEYRVVVGAGRLTRAKDFPTLIRAFAIVRRLRADARLLILGDGDEREHLEALVHELDLASFVCFTGFVPNPAAYLSKAAVFVLSSVWEGFGNVLAEAIAVGTPVVSTDCPSGPAEILANGRYGALVNVSDPSALAHAIIEALDRPTDRNTLQTRARAFSADAATDQLLDVLHPRGL